MNKDFPKAQFFRVFQAIDEISNNKNFTIIDCIKEVTESLLQLDFRQVYYFDVLENALLPSPQFVLSAYSANVSSEEAPVLGMKLYSAGWYKRIDEMPSIVTSSDAGNHPLRSWYFTKVFNSASYLELPLIFEGELFSILACDCGDSPDRIGINADGITLLREIGNKIMNLIIRRLMQSVNVVIEKITASGHTSNSLDQFLASSAGIIATHLFSDHTSVFKVNWIDREIERTFEMPKLSKASSDNEISEFYTQSTLSEAFVNPKYRAIVDVYDLIKSDRSLFSQDELSFIHNLPDKIKSIFYTPIGIHRPIILLRMITFETSRVSVRWQKMLIDGIKDVLSRLTDSIQKSQRLNNFQSLCRLTFAGLHVSPNFFEQLRIYLESEDVADFGVLSHLEGSSRFETVKSFGNTLSELPITRSEFWPSEHFYKSGIELLEEGYVDIHSGWQDSKIGAFLFQQGFTNTIIFPFSGGQTRGILFIPMRLVSRKKRKSFKEEFSHDIEKIEMIKALVELLGHFIEARASAVSIRTARNVFGHIGHEIGGSMAELAETSSSAITKWKKLLHETMGPSGCENASEIEAAQRLTEKIDELKSEMSYTLNLALLTSDTGHTELQVHFKKEDLFEILRIARENCLRGHVVQNLRSGKSIDLQFSPSCSNLGMVVCDRYLIMHVFVNLLNNAAKYSMSLWPGGPTTIKVMAQPQSSMTIIQVENWGIGISEHLLEDIFRPFYRSNIKDEVKAIRGMGLGLFLARRIMRAHRGEVFCRESRPTFDDPIRRKRMEGFKTTFEVRIPNHLKEGTFIYKFGDQ